MSGFGFGNGGQSSDKQTTSSNGGHLKSLPSKGGVHASAGGCVTGAVQPTNINGIAKYLIKMLHPKMYPQVFACFLR